MPRRQFEIASDLLRHCPEDLVIETLGQTLCEQAGTDVTQEQLRELLRLQRVVHRHQNLRNKIRRDVQAGASIEPGMVGAFVRSFESKIISAAKLRKVLDDDTVATILQRIEPTTVHQLILWEDLSQI